MDLTSEEIQMIISSRINHEMKKAKEVLNSWNASWSHTYREESSEDSNTVYKSSVEWSGITTKKAERRIIFNSNGDIFLEKKGKGKNKNIKYKANYNVCNNDFDISIVIDDPENDNYHKSEYVNVSLKDNILTERLNDIIICTDIDTGKKKIMISKDYDPRKYYVDNAAVNFEANLNEDGKISSASAEITTHKGNGKVNGTYRFDVNKEKGVRANFYSRKGKKHDLISNIPLLENANKLLLNKTRDNEIIIYNFATAAQQSIFYGVDARKIRFDDSNFSLDAIYDAEEKINNMIERLKGDVFLQGLSDRISLYQENIKKNSKQKVLKLENIIDE